jgi:prepilin-type N-terminal cleavage/methylation domain-containing protein/prepilin-type processing-associated H-X9-DG protein
MGLFMRRTRRHGLTLIELLVTIAILAVVIGLLAVAIVKIRSAAQRAECGNNLKQLGLACHGANSQHKRMPPAFGFYPFTNIYDGANGLGNVFFHLLPHLSQQTLYNQSHYQAATRPPQNFLFYTAHGVHQTPVSAFNCPSDPTLLAGIDPATQYAFSSYAASYLVFGIVDKNYANKNAGGKPKLGDSFPDGVSTTILFAEKYAAASDGTRRGGCHWAYFQADCQNPLFAYHEPARGNRRSLTDPNGVGTASRFQVQPSQAACNPCLPATGHSAMNVCMADGSVRGLSASMDGAVWWSLVTPAGGESLPRDW